MACLEDTEWTDALKKLGIIKEEPKKSEEIEEIEVPKEIKFDNSDDENAWLEDNDDEDFIRNYRAKRMNEIQLQSQKPRFGEVVEITATDYVMQVNRAGEGIWVILLLYRPGHPMSTQMQDILNDLARKFPETKFLKSISTLCIANFPDQNLPAVFIYQNGQLVKQLIGPVIFGEGKITSDEVEWIVSRTGAISTALEKDPRKKAQSRKYYEQFDSDSD